MEIAMTRITLTSGSFATQFDTIFTTVIASCADFCGEARQGRDIEARYQTRNRCSGSDHDVARTAPTDTRH
jgi:hypothetical protein